MPLFHNVVAQACFSKQHCVRTADRLNTELCSHSTYIIVMKCARHSQKNCQLSVLCDLMVHAGVELCADNTVPVAQKTHGNHSVTRAWTQRRCCWCFWTAFIQRFFYLVSKILLGLNKKYAYVIKKNQLHSSASDFDMLSVYFYVIQV